MLDWLDRIDDSVFSPPHRFEAILAFTVVRLGLVFEGGADEGTDGERLSEESQWRQEAEEERS